VEDDERWTDEDDTRLHVAGLTEVHPTFTAMHFLSALGQLPGSSNYLGSKVTPESRAWWGDFSAAAGFIDSLNQPGIISIVRGFPDALDVAWVLIIENDDRGRWHDGLPTNDAAVAYFTMVNRPSLGGWRVHHIGDEIELALVPRDPATTSKNESSRPSKRLHERFRLRRK
jgi:hypothetical protein